MQELISIIDASKIYRSGESTIAALDHISLAIEEGEFVAIIGSSGSGKSTLMNIIGCLDMPTSGQYCLEGIDISTKTDDELSSIRNRKIGFIFQGFNLIESLNAIENVELPLIYRGVKRHNRHELAVQALAQVGLSERNTHLPSQMSGGQQQRVAIARAIAARPPILLADEPTGNLDKQSGNDIMEILLDLNREGKTIILITHDAAIAKRASRVIRITEGQVAKEG